MNDPRWAETVHLSNGIEVKQSSLGGLGVFATRNISKDEIIMKISKTSILSPKNSDLKNIIENEEDLEPVDQLIVCYLYEKMKGQKSPISFYVDFLRSTTLPDVPFLWTSEEQKWLGGTNIATWVVPDIEEVRESYTRCENVLKQAEKYGAAQAVLFDEFKDAYLLVNSRMFNVDNYHGFALVPGACFFNHSDRESVHFETDGMVCSNCGKLNCGCSAHSDDNESSYGDNTEDEDEFLGEITNAPSISSGSSIRANDKGIVKGVDENICEIRTVQTLQSGNEIFNTYGEDPNGIILSRYGFVIWNNINDMVDFDIELEEYAESIKKLKVLNTWRDLQEEIAAEEDNDELSFVGIINGPEKPRISPGLTSIAQKLKIPDVKLAKKLAQSRYKKYHLEGTSSQLKGSSRKETDSRKQRALVAVGTEKLILEYFLK